MKTDEEMRMKESFGEAKDDCDTSQNSSKGKMNEKKRLEDVNSVLRDRIKALQSGMFKMHWVITMSFDVRFENCKICQRVDTNCKSYVWCEATAAEQRESLLIRKEKKERDLIDKFENILFLKAEAV